MQGAKGPAEACDYPHVLSSGSRSAPVEERTESMALTGAAAGAPTHISGVLSDIHQDTVIASFKLD